ncbi:hypothetical protein [Mesorhizobium sp. B2-1-5]|uniref:hypothetical protein n=1 Tax=Mesorhizobium sp. B2-1-5 TaxID=2589969 RepID=UPI00112C3A49|nr:hypothetical protein [Mesorhizobium sp. B2-1-5]TPN02465.1 hypothetical protein FJ966_04100 [Mesorhizobium sp. B2-1-5]
MPLPSLVNSWKSIVNPIEWSKPDPEDGYIRFYAPPEIDGIVEAGLVLTGGTYSQHPDWHVTFELSVAGLAGHRHTKLIRVDWRDTKGGHSNNRRKCAGDGKRVPETHLHSFELNWIEAERRMKRGKLPCAEAIDQELQSFEQLRSFVGTRFRINNIGIVPRPDWVYDLFQ